MILSTNGSGVLKLWIDASYAVYPNMWGHTGGGISMGKVFPIVALTDHMINTHSSTESEIVGVHNYMPAIG